jgi:hypothetical protein
MRVFYQVVLFVISSLLSINAHGVMLWQPINPSSQFSANGDYQLRVDPSDPRGRGSAQYEFYYKDELIWSKQWPFTLVQYQLSNQGEIAGVSKVTDWKESERVVRIFDAKGEELYTKHYPTTAVIVDGPALPAISHMYIHDFQHELRYQVWREKERGSERIWTHIDLNRLVATEHTGPDSENGFFNRVIVADPASSNILVYQRSNQKEHRYCLYDGAYLEISCKQLASDDQALDAEQKREQWRLQDLPTVIGFENTTFWITDFLHLRRNYYRFDEKRWRLAKSRSLEVKNEPKALPALIPETQFTLPAEAPHFEKLDSVSGIYVDEQERVYFYDYRQKRLVRWFGDSLKMLFQPPEEKRKKRSAGYLRQLTLSLDHEHFLIPTATRRSVKTLDEYYRVSLDGSFEILNLVEQFEHKGLRYGYVPHRSGFWSSGYGEIYLTLGLEEKVIRRDSWNQWLTACTRLIQNENGWLAVLCRVSHKSEDKVVVVNDEGALVQTIRYQDRVASVQVAQDHIYVSTSSDGFSVFDLTSGAAVAQFVPQQTPSRYSQGLLYINLKRNRLYYFYRGTMYRFKLL